MNGVLVDTHVLIHAYQAGEGDPRAQPAKSALEDLAHRGEGHVSVQTLAEFSRVLQTKLDSPVPASALRETIGRLEQVFGVVRPSAATVTRALHAVERHGLPFWDAMLWAAAHENGIAEILTGEPPKQAEIEGVRYRSV